jgi:hypothetical protein
MKRLLGVVIITLLLSYGICFAEEAPFYEVILESYAYGGNCYQIKNLSLPSPVPTPSPKPPKYMGPSLLQDLENTLSEYGMDAGQRQEYLVHMDHYSRYNLYGTQRIIGNGCVYIPTFSTLNYKDDIWIQYDSFRISTMEDDKEGEGQWGIGFALIVKTEGKIEEEIIEMLNTLQIEISYVTEIHMDYDEEYDIEFEDYNEASRTSVVAKISSEGLVRSLDDEERIRKMGGWRDSPEEDADRWVEVWTPVPASTGW